MRENHAACGMTPELNELKLIWRNLLLGFCVIELALNFCC